MKKINTILATLGAILMLTVTSANSAEFSVGVSANGLAGYGNAKETIKGTGAHRTSNEEAVIASSYASIFAEMSSDEAMGLGIGISYAPEVVNLPKETRIIQNTSGDSGNDTGTQQIAGDITDYVAVYLTFPVGDSGAFVKGGYNQATLETKENLATGSKYENIDLTGTFVGGGYEAGLGDMMFWRAEGTFHMWDDISVNGSESNNGTTDTAKNKIEAELGAIVGSLSIGMRF